jgi:hypothetical protein
MYIVLLPACSKSLWGTVSLIPVEKKIEFALSAHLFLVRSSCSDASSSAEASPLPLFLPNNSSSPLNPDACGLFERLENTDRIEPSAQRAAISLSFLVSQHKVQQIQFNFQRSIFNFNLQKRPGFASSGT